MLAAKAITALDGPCWELVDLDGKPGDDGGDSIAHYSSTDEAWKAYEDRFRWWEEEDGPKPSWVPRELDQPCLTLTTVCGYVLDQDGDGICHQHDREVLYEWAMGMGFLLMADGSMLCGPE